MKNNTILSKKIGTNLITRNVITLLFEKLNPEEEITMDFKDIEFISRSAADQYLKEKAKSNKKITETNISDKVYLMFELVKRQYEKENVPITFLTCNDRKEILNQ